MSAFHRTTPSKSKAAVREMYQRLTSDIRVGFAVVPYSKEFKGWLLPEGQSQKNRVVMNYERALQFAQRMNDILSRYPSLMARLERREAA